MPRPRVYGKLWERVTLTLPPTLVAKLRDLAEVAGRTVSEVVAEAVRFALDRGFHPTNKDLDEPEDGPLFTSGSRHG